MLVTEILKDKGDAVFSVSPAQTLVEACREMRDNNKDIRVLMLTSYSDEEAVMGSIMAGASGYLLKEIRSPEIVDAIRAVAEGRTEPGPDLGTVIVKAYENEPGAAK